MNNAEKRAAVAAEIAAHPEDSDREIARRLGVAHTFVGDVRNPEPDSARVASALPESARVTLLENPTPTSAEVQAAIGDVRQILDKASAAVVRIGRNVAEDSLGRVATGDTKTVVKLGQELVEASAIEMQAKAALQMAQRKLEEAQAREHREGLLKRFKRAQALLREREDWAALADSCAVALTLCRNRVLELGEEAWAEAPVKTRRDFLPFFSRPDVDGAFERQVELGQQINGHVGDPDGALRQLLTMLPKTHGTLYRRAVASSRAIRSPGHPTAIHGSDRVKAGEYVYQDGRPEWFAMWREVTKDTAPVGLPPEQPTFEMVPRREAPQPVPRTDIESEPQLITATEKLRRMGG